MVFKWVTGVIIPVSGVRPGSWAHLGTPSWLRMSCFGIAIPLPGLWEGTVPQPFWGGFLVLAPNWKANCFSRDNWVLVSNSVLFSPRSLGFHDPIWQAYFCRWAGWNHHLDNHGSGKWYLKGDYFWRYINFFHWTMSMPWLWAWQSHYNQKVPDPDDGSHQVE